MRRCRSLAALAAVLVPTTATSAQAIIAQLSGLANPDRVIDFGASVYPNWTNITTQFAGITVTHADYFTTGSFNNLVGGFLTNDGSGAPNTLRIQFAQPIRGLSFVYQQIGASQPSVFRALFGGTVVAGFNILWDPYQPNNFFGFTNIVFDELQIDFDSDFNIDTLAIHDFTASCTIRNGTGLNPVHYTCQTMPVLGSNWLSSIVTNGNTIGTFLAFAPGGPHPGLPFLGGEILVQPTPGPIVLAGSGSFSVAIPTGPIWLGYPVATQGIRLETGGFVLLNAVDLVLGL